MPASESVPVRGESAYDVVVGHGVVARALDAIGPAARTVAVLRAPGVEAATREVLALLRDAGLSVVDLELPDAESAKTVDAAARCWEALGAAGMTRTDAIVSVGGGATTDLAGFVAGTWMRGIRVVHVPTTVLAMVDAAVGGKTGINTGRGKNLVGVIHEPAGVVCDLDFLRTLPVADVAAGLAEVVKAGLIRDAEILRLVEQDPSDALRWDGDRLAELVVRSIRVKADVVSGDLRESLDRPLGREVLNYGHTFGHAVEQAEDYRWRHGHAVSVGMVYVAELAALAGRLPQDDVARHREVLGALGLPVAYAGGRWDRLHAAMRVDKKARADRIRFVVLDGIGHPGLLEGPADDLLHAAYRKVST